ncbi:hypothetical protein AB1Y20_021720 [Prymnesium parvum]|uniref:UDP-galactose transporter n=1 Tax=Prymnesium parvum TaxID=97485 RepID=A0AB34JMD2_PRYPA|mmetsp:Transcript_36124/g.82769  ORF Transcript_36124/g.82769 Transcript_36124/m.82769 type:complete len:371 (-) Transcript_36124:310-1422(-)
MASGGSYEVVGKASPRHAEERGLIDEDEEDGSRAIASGDGEKDSLVSRTDSSSEPGPTSRFSLRLLILVSVTLQNTMYALVRRYSRGTLHEKYSTSSVLLAMELAKLTLSAERVVHCGLPSDVPEGSALSKYLFLLKTSMKMSVPAVIYLVMNMLGFLSLAYVDAATFSIVAQLKVFSTAMFSVLVLGRELGWRKWRALTTLTLGVILISHEAMPKSEQQTEASARALTEYMIGMSACMGDVLLSGFASIYFEKVLKSKTETYSVWDRNFQLAFWSSMMYMPIMFYDNPTQPFAGWTMVTVSCAAVGALGGVLVALSIKHADSILKTIATTGAIVLTTVLNAAFMNGPRSLPIVTGALVVVVSVFNYNDS